MPKNLLVLLLLLLGSYFARESNAFEPPKAIKRLLIGEGWANNSVNAVIFRRNSLVTHGNTQYAAYYNAEKFVVLAKRTHGSEAWEIKQTPLKGNAADAHNAISLMADGDGYLHLAWDHHDNALHYARSIRPGSLELEVLPAMTGLEEAQVSYPEFYRLPSGDLLFFYRNGASGRGSLVMNRYDRKARQWTPLQQNLIDGEGERNAYWQACVDARGTIHVSWVWRESPDVASNHDLCYARSRDGGISWENSKGQPYQLPIREQSAEVARAIPQGSELINQTSMTADHEGNPIIASYWREQASAIPQYRLLYYTNGTWNTMEVLSRKTPFSLNGAGTKRIPISRPQVLLTEKRNRKQVLLLFRDAERGDKASVAINRNFPKGTWEVEDLTQESLGAWEPTYDTESWSKLGLLHLFVQPVEQVDAEGLAESTPRPVSVLEWRPLSRKQ
jgi:hypothetical protein